MAIRWYINACEEELARDEGSLDGGDRLLWNLLLLILRPPPPTYPIFLLVLLLFPFMWDSEDDDIGGGPPLLPIIGGGRDDLKEDPCELFLFDPNRSDL